MANLAAAARAAFLTAPQELRRKPRRLAVHREDFVEEAAMAREMFRL